MNKNNDLDHLKSIAAECSRLGIEMDFSLLTNTFSETQETLEETKTFLNSFLGYFFRQPPAINFITPVPGTRLYEEAKKRRLVDADDLANILRLNGASRYALECNLTQFETGAFLSAVWDFNEALRRGYYRRHPMQRLMALGNLDHFRWKETLLSLSPGNLRPLLEGLLWTLCKGRDDSALGRFYRQLVYGE